MNSPERRMVEALERRRAHLEARLDDWRSPFDPSRTAHEAKALRWALRIIAAAEAEGILRDLADLTHEATGEQPLDLSREATGYTQRQLDQMIEILEMTGRYDVVGRRW